MQCVRQNSGLFIRTKLYKDLVRITLIDFCQCNVIKGKISLGATSNSENCAFVFNPDNPCCQSASVCSADKSMDKFDFIGNRYQE